MQYILIHGLGQNSSSWNKTISHMAVKDNIVCPDLSLFLKDGDITYSNLYQLFSEYCNSILQPLNLYGISLGAVLALNYAIDNPSKVKSLILIAPQYKMPRVLLKLQNIIFKFIPETSFKSVGLQKQDFIKLTNSMMSIDFSNSLNNISCPVLVVCGNKDIANKKAAMSLAESVPKAQIKFIKNAKHEVNIDAPKELAEIFNEFNYRDKL